jgi:hypothetical protein
MFTVIGIPLALVSLVIWGVLLYLSQIPVALIIGWLILTRGKETTSTGLLIGALALGLFILHLIGLIPVFGWIFWLFCHFLRTVLHWLRYPVLPLPNSQVTEIK